jgi:hypothetical protein
MVFDHGFKAKALALLTLGLIFGAGLGIGLAWDRDLIAGATDESTQVGADEQADRERGSGERTLIVEQVGLTVEQKLAIDGTIDEQRKLMRVIQEEFKEVERHFNERYRAAIHDTRELIKTHLTDEQSSQYDVLLAEFDERRLKKREQRQHEREHPIP